MDVKQATPVISKSGPHVLIAGVAWFLTYLAARLAIEAMAQPPTWDIVVACAPVLAFFWFVGVVQRTLKNADELRRRMHLEALGLSFLTTMLVLMLLGLLENAPPPWGPLLLPLRDLWLVLPPLYGICFVVVNQRYR